MADDRESRASIVEKGTHLDVLDQHAEPPLAPRRDNFLTANHSKEESERSSRRESKRFASAGDAAQIAGSGAQEYQELYKRKYEWPHKGRVGVELQRFRLEAGPGGGQAREGLPSCLPRAHAEGAERARFPEEEGERVGVQAAQGRPHQEPRDNARLVPKRGAKSRQHLRELQA